MNALGFHLDMYASICICIGISIQSKHVSTRSLRELPGISSCDLSKDTVMLILSRVHYCDKLGITIPT